MVFSSVLFLCYFLPVVILVYFFIPYKFKNYWLLAGSMFFYAWGAPKFIAVVISVLVIDYIFGNKIYTSEGRTRKFYLALSVILNMGMLFYFKYSNFFIENINAVLLNVGWTAVKWTQVVLPIGISFFTFQEMSYTIDIYRGEHKPLKKFSDYMLFIFMFSHLIAGPIVTYNVLADDIVDRRKKLNNDYRILGFYRFMIGLARKVLIANVLGEVADEVFSMPVLQLSSMDCWIGALAYTFQLYFDFAGYSDMAIGLGKLFGFDFPENFNAPYISESITEFWRRWHITLSNWMKRYLYISLGGNRLSDYRTYFNLWIVFLLSGLWHGSNWTFVIWGAYHGFFIATERLLKNNISFTLPGVIKMPLTFLIVLVGWVFFRAENLHYATGMIMQMFSFRSAEINIIYSNRFIPILLFAVIISVFPAFPGCSNVLSHLFKVEDNMALSSIRFLTTVLLFVICLATIVTSGFNPFIYFRF